ncbi:hypothetical protein GQ600_21350 [Phytophthora cactorum]|nr:hypothetical protein GQ600_21350 [Phytophthora cactorum]
MEQANALIQGTLIPCARHSNAASSARTPCLSCIISQADAPMWKSTTVVQTARKRKVQRQVKICLAGIRMYRESLPNEHDAGKMGVTITKLGTSTEEDLITMKQWQDETPKLEAVSDLASWIRVSKFFRVSLPAPFNNCVNVDTKACASPSRRRPWRVQYRLVWQRPSS